MDTAKSLIDSGLQLREKDGEWFVVNQAGEERSLQSQSARDELFAFTRSWSKSRLATLLTERWQKYLGLSKAAAWHALRRARG